MKTKVITAVMNTTQTIMNSENEACKKGCTLFYSTQKGESIDHLTDLGLPIGLVEMKCN